MRRRVVEFKFPLIVIRSERMLRPLERLGRTRVMGPLSVLSLIAMPVLAGTATYFLLISLMAILTRPEVQQAQREAGPASFLLLPGINPYLPVIYGWLGIFVALMVHEGAHGIIAMRYGYTVKSTGLILFLGIPIGAFVETEDSEMRQGRLREVLKILSAGPTSNAVVAIASLVAMVAIASSVTVSLPLEIESVMEGGPASAAGLRPNDQINSVNGVPVNSVLQLSNAFASIGIGGKVELGVIRDGNFLTVSLTLADIGGGRPGIGVLIREADFHILAAEVLERYRRITTSNPLAFFAPPTFNVVVYPFSEVEACFVTGDSVERCRTISSLFTHPVLGGSYAAVSNALYWMWFVNINVAIFNALPIYPLDGGQAVRKTLSTLLRSGDRSGIVITITTAVSLFFLSMLLSIILLPYVLVG
ncbi:MAG: site-2 protease family protein [Thaumarchaeota archaeon]|nr:site-2 protease family protein [Candidatus Calditenuaceae archaeon]MDW8041405.1 site-2 protease family protein [Nitrososphaerota archaeon]